MRLLRIRTYLERRFTGEEIKSMMEIAGLEEISFKSEVSYWYAVGYKKCLK